MSEIDWSKAPEWAHWAAMDIYGDWYWYAQKPEKGAYVWHPRGFCEPMEFPSWEDTLQRRPENEQP